MHDVEDTPAGTTSIGLELITLTLRNDVMNLVMDLLLAAFCSITAVGRLSTSCVVSTRRRQLHYFWEIETTDCFLFVSFAHFVVFKPAR